MAKDFAPGVFGATRRSRSRAAGKKAAALKSKTKKPLILCILIIAGILIHSAVQAGDEAEWEHYIRHFGSVKTEADAVLILGKPLRIERDYDSIDTQRLIYSTLYYDGYSLGIWGNSQAKIGCINIYEKGIMPLRYGLDIGSTREEIELAYWDASKMSDADGFILTHRDEFFYEGIWIYLDFDDDGILVEYSVTDGF